jgi:hypothetical protein
MKTDSTKNTDYFIFEDVEAAIKAMNSTASPKYEDFFEFCTASLRDDSNEVTDYNDKHGV